MILLANTTLSDQLGAVSHITLTQGHPVETAITFGNIASHIAEEKERGKGVCRKNSLPDATSITSPHKSLARGSSKADSAILPRAQEGGQNIQWQGSNAYHSNYTYLCPKSYFTQIAWSRDLKLVIFIN